MPKELQIMPEQVKPSYFKELMFYFERKEDFIKGKKNFLNCIFINKEYQTPELLQLGEEFLNTLFAYVIKIPVHLKRRYLLNQERAEEKEGRLYNKITNLSELTKVHKIKQEILDLFFESVPDSIKFPKNPGTDHTNFLKKARGHIQSIHEIINSKPGTEGADRLGMGWYDVSQALRCQYSIFKHPLGYPTNSGLVSVELPLEKVLKRKENQKFLPKNAHPSWILYGH